MNTNSFTFLTEWFVSDGVLRLTQTLAHFLWQGCVVAVVYAVIARSLRNAPARIRYGFGVLALLCMAACLPITCWLLPPMPKMSPAVVVDLSSSVTNAGNTPSDTSFSPTVYNFSMPKIAEEQSKHPDSISNTQKLAKILAWASPYASGLYFCGVAIMLLRVSLGLWGGRRLCRSATPILEHDVVQAVADHARRVGLRVIPVVAYCERITMPMVVGLIKPMILLPVGLAAGLTISQLESVLLHELAHIRRLDLLVNVFQRMVESFGFFHPAVWWISRQVSRERENACDDLAIHSHISRTQYADALVRMAELCLALHNQRSLNQVMLAAAGENPSQFKRRIERILGIDAAPRLRISTFSLLTAMAMAALVTLAPWLCRNMAYAQLAPSEQTTASQETTTSPKSEPSGKILERIYHLKYVSSQDVEKYLQPCLSTRGTMETLGSQELQDRTEGSKEIPIGSGVGSRNGQATRPGTLTTSSSEILRVCDEEVVLQGTDRIVAEVDVPPKQVLIEATIVRVDWNADADRNVLHSLVGDPTKLTENTGVNTPHSDLPRAFTGEVLYQKEEKDHSLSMTVRGPLISFWPPKVESPLEFVHALEKQGKTKVLACPRILVLNKQSAEFQLGGRDSESVGRDPLLREFHWRFRPFVGGNNGMISFEAQVVCRLPAKEGPVDSEEVSPLTTNIMVPDGCTTVLQMPDSDWMPKDATASLEQPSDKASSLFLILTPRLYKPDAGVASIEPARRLLREVLFVGCKEINKRTLQKEVELKAGDAADPSVIEKARGKLEAFYHQKGFAQAKVQILEGNKPDDFRAVFLILEDAKPKIKKVQFIGNATLGNDVLQSKLPRGHLSCYFLGGKLNQKQIEEDQERLTAYYRCLGFFRVKIGDPTITSNEKTNGLTLTYVINEGIRYRIRNISFIGNTKLASEELLATLKMKESDYFNQETLQSGVRALTNQYGHIGHAFARMEFYLRFPKEPGQVDIVVKITEGNRYRVGQVMVHSTHGEQPDLAATGASLTADSIQIGEFSLKQGDIIDLNAIQGIERKLQQSGRFENGPGEAAMPIIALGQTSEKDPKTGDYVANVTILCGRARE
jgi:beta-lactamase regulating signal transducer with metallopeptidase domain